MFRMVHGEISLHDQGQGEGLFSYSQKVKGEDEKMDRLAVQRLEYKLYYIIILSYSQRLYLSLSLLYSLSGGDEKMRK